MKILHTSDWHIGKSLYGKQRYSEMELFLDWLIDYIKSNHVDILIVAGDIFDTTTPSNRAQSIYFDFLNRMKNTPCLKTIIISGNHDSPTLLSASKPILKGLNIEVVTKIEKELSKNIFTVVKGEDQLVICGVPYLRERDIRTFDEDENEEDKRQKYSRGIERNYSNLIDLAKDIRESEDIPIIATGHLFAAGSSSIDGDGVRDLYVGNVSHFDTKLFPKEIDFLALGHIHQPQIVGKVDHFRYSGSPLPVNFGEKFKRNMVIEVELKNGDKKIREISVPSFQHLLKIEGGLEEVKDKLQVAIDEDISIWVEVEYRGEKVISNLKEILFEFVENSKVEILKISNRELRISLADFEERENLEEMDHIDVFQKLLDGSRIELDQQNDLKEIYRELTNTIYEEDSDEDC